MTGWRNDPGGSEAAPGADGRRGGPGFGRRLRAVPVLIVVLVVAAGVSLAVKLAAGTASRCQSDFVPAFFEPQGWNQAAQSGADPAVIILNPASGPGTGPQPAFQAAVNQARGSGSHVIGYIGTEYSQRPLAEAEAYVRHYREWYGVTGIFLDQTPTEGSQQIGYYRQLTRYIHQVSPGATIWLNPGVYPDPSYMSVGNVVMVFEGPYASYQHLKVPAWAHRYAASRFAHTVYATPGRDLASAVRLSRIGHAGYVYITDKSGPNPYSGLPGYWAREQAAVAGNCARA